MSDLIVPVVKVQNVRVHPNADTLDLCDVLGYQVVVGRGQYKDGDLCVYFPMDVCLPSAVSEPLGCKKYLGGPEQTRVGRIKLRGEASFGILIAKPEDQYWIEGDNVATYYGCTKWVGPVKFTSGDMAGYDELIDPFFEEFTHIQNGRIYSRVFEEGEYVIVTEKIHGANCRIGLINGIWVAGSHHTRRKLPEGEGDFTGYWTPMNYEGVRRMIMRLNELNDGKPVIIYGELYGKGVQSLTYGCPNSQAFRAFGASVGGRYLSWTALSALAVHCGLEMCPVIWAGEYSLDKMKELADGKSRLADHMREGIVVYPVTERTHPKIGRVVLKFIGKEYLMSKHKDQELGEE